MLTAALWRRHFAFPVLMCIQGKWELGAMALYHQYLSKLRLEPKYVQLCSSWVVQMVKNLPAMPETWVQSLGWEDSLGEGMATTPVLLPGESPWTEEPGGLQSMALQRVGHDWAVKSSTAQQVWLQTALLSTIPGSHGLWSQPPFWAHQSPCLPSQGLFPAALNFLLLSCSPFSPSCFSTCMPMLWVHKPHFE